MRAGARMGTTNKDGVSIFNAPVATKQLLVKLLGKRNFCFYSDICTPVTMGLIITEKRFHSPVLVINVIMIIKLSMRLAQFSDIILQLNDEQVDPFQTCCPKSLPGVKGRTVWNVASSLESRHANITGRQCSSTKK